MMNPIKTVRHTTTILRQEAGGALAMRSAPLLGRALLVLIGALAASAMIFLFVATSKEAHAATFSNTNQILINDSATPPTKATPYPSQISVSGQSGVVSDVNLKLNLFEHTWPDDVDVLLVGPTGKNAIVMSDVGGGNAVSGVNLTLTDEAANSLPDSGQLTSGTYKPTNVGTGDSFPDAPTPSGSTALSTFDGTNPNGTWKLFVVDDETDASIPGVGKIVDGWSLDISTFVDTDTLGPRVSSTVPTKGATGVGPNANVKANFSEDMRASTINGQTFKLFKKGSTTKVGATVSYNATMDRAILNPTNSLRRGVTYKAVVTTGAKDEAGNSLDQNRSLSGLQQKSWSFTISN